VVLISLSLNLAIAWVLFLQSNRLVSFLGQGGIRAFSKVISMLLAAIGVRMVLTGILQVLGR